MSDETFIRHTQNFESRFMAFFTNVCYTRVKKIWLMIIPAVFCCFHEKVVRLFGLKINNKVKRFVACFTSAMCLSNKHYLLYFV